MRRDCFYDAKLLGNYQHFALLPSLGVKKLLSSVCYMNLNANKLLTSGELCKLDKQTGIKFDKIEVPVERILISKHFLPASWSAWFTLMTLKSFKTY